MAHSGHLCCSLLWLLSLSSIRGIDYGTGTGHTTGVAPFSQGGHYVHRVAAAQRYMWRVQQVVPEHRKTRCRSFSRRDAALLWPPLLPRVPKADDSVVPVRGRRSASWHFLPLSRSRLAIGGSLFAAALRPAFLCLTLCLYFPLNCCLVKLHL